MKKSALFILALFALAGMAVQKVEAGSVVLTDGHGNLSTAYGGPVDRETQRALDKAHRRYGFGKFRVLASSDVTGYGAIVVARHPNGYGSLIGVALGRRSAHEAYTVAMQECLKAGGTHAKIKWAFKG